MKPIYCMLISRNFCWKSVKEEKFTLTQKIFRQINSLVISLVKTLLSRNFCQKCVRENFRNFHSVSAQCSQNFQNRNLRVKNYFSNFGILTFWPSSWVHGQLEIYSFEHMNHFNHGKNLDQSWQKTQNLLKLFIFY